MNQYFTATTDPSTWVSGSYVFQNLPGGGCFIVLFDGQPDPSWIALPSLLSQDAAGFDGIQTILGSTPQDASGITPLASVLPTDTAFAVATKMTSINPMFSPHF